MNLTKEKKGNVLFAINKKNLKVKQKVIALMIKIVKRF